MNETKKACSLKTNITDSFSLVWLRGELQLQMLDKTMESGIKKQNQHY